MIETVTHNGEIIAIILYQNYCNKGVTFLTPNEFLLQVGYMNHPAGYQIEPHVHLPVRRETSGTQEVLFIKGGVVKVDLFSPDQVYLESRKLTAGDIILLAGAGHGISVLEDASIIEVKNGPYLSELDKKRFQNKR